MSRFAGQVAVITGGAQGIGYSVAAALGAEGAAVVLLDLTPATLAGAAATLTAAGVARVSTQAVDVSREADWARAIAAVLAEHGRIDVLVQAAGITGKTGVKTADVDPANWAAVMAVNATGIFLGCRAVLPSMVAAGYGRIINIASVAGKEGNAGMCPYSASKGAVIALTKAAGKEYAEAGITINAVAPAVIRTAMVDAMPEEQVKYMTDKIPMKRCGTVGEIAALIAFIASKDAGFTTGERGGGGGGARARGQAGRQAGGRTAAAVAAAALHLQSCAGAQPRLKKHLRHSPPSLTCRFHVGHDRRPRNILEKRVARAAAAARRRALPLRRHFFEHLPLRG